MKNDQATFGWPGRFFASCGHKKTKEIGNGTDKQGVRQLWHPEAKKVEENAKGNASRTDK